MAPTFELHDSQILLGSLAETFPAWLERQNYSQVFVIADENTQHQCLPVFMAKTRLNPLPYLAIVAAGEDQKNLASCEKIWLSMLQSQLDRKALVINLGGGVIGDMGGFCAAAWKRGVDFVHVPTTLLAMTDAAIGGKLGVDFQGIKNIIGIFRQPAAVFVDPVFLETLPERELRSGMAEIVKHALIGDTGLWNNLAEWNGLPPSTAWLELLRASIAVKVRVVTDDPYEKGLRMLLNYGHTIGHAVESYFLDTDQPLTHGEAVAIGMICETAPSPRREALVALLSVLYPHRSIPEAAFPELWQRMLQDKKNASGQVRMALPGPTPYTMEVVEVTEREMAHRLAEYNRLAFGV